MEDRRTSNKKKKSRQARAALFNLIIMCMVTLTAVTICLFVLFRYHSVSEHEKELTNQLEQMEIELANSYSEEAVQKMLDSAREEAKKGEQDQAKSELLTGLRSDLQNSDSMLRVLRSYYPDDIVLSLGGRYYFYSIDQTLKKTTIDADSYQRSDSGIVTYEKDGVVGKIGIDVSKFQEKIDWKKVASDSNSPEYAIIRLGVRGYTEGAISEDEYFETNIKGALKNGLKVGVYFFTQATSVEEAEEEASFVLDALEPYKVEYPVVIDVEKVGGGKSRTESMTISERTDCVIAFCEMIKRSGYTPMIYGNTTTFLQLLDMTRLEEYEKWIASYEETMFFPYEYSIWQYTDEGSISGISKDVDYNISFFKP